MCGILISNCTAPVRWLSNKLQFWVLDTTYWFWCTFLICLYRCITGVLHAVQETVDDRDNIAATTERRRKSRLCHINVLKLYLDRDSAPVTPAKESNTVLFAVQHWNLSQGWGCLGCCLVPMCLRRNLCLQSLMLMMWLSMDDLQNPKCCQNLTVADHTCLRLGVDVVHWINSHLSMFSDIQGKFGAVAVQFCHSLAEAGVTKLDCFHLPVLSELTNRSVSPRWCC